MSTTLTDATRTARKAHVCDWCRDPIERGDRYRDVRTADSGTVYVFKSHPACDARVERYARDLGLVDDDWAHIEWVYVLEWEAEQTDE